MAQENESEDKQHAPTQKKLDDARKRGEVPRSTDLVTAASYGGFLLAVSAIGASSFDNGGRILSELLAHSPEWADQVFRSGGANLASILLSGIAKGFLPWILIPGALILATLIASRSLTFSAQKMMPKLSKINPLANARNKFGRSGLFEFAKSFVKLSVYSVALGAFLWRKTPIILGTFHLSHAGVVVTLFKIVLEFFTIVFVIAMMIGIIDYFWQRAEHLRKNRMSNKEMRDEAKESEGDPHVKQQRRQKGYDIAMNNMLAEVPNADVVVVNPQHFAVALAWSRLPGTAPVCVAKGVDEIAARIREAAAEHGVPIHRDPPTARAIYATVEIGEEVRPDHYQAIAAAIRFAEAMRKKARAGLGVSRTGGAR